MQAEWIIGCRCGDVALKASGRPIISTACYCTDCQAAGRGFETLPGAARVATEDGGTPAVLFRKDRVTFERGTALLRETHLKDDSPTRRVVASCCTTPLFLDYTKGFWLSLYTERFVGASPPLECRSMTRERPAGIALPGDVPNPATVSGTFMLRLALAWLMMGFRIPRLERFPPLPQALRDPGLPG